MIAHFGLGQAVSDLAVKLEENDKIRGLSAKRDVSKSQRPRREVEVEKGKIVEKEMDVKRHPSAVKLEETCQICMCWVAICLDPCQSSQRGGVERDGRQVGPISCQGNGIDVYPGDTH